MYGQLVFQLSYLSGRRRRFVSRMEEEAKLFRGIANAASIAELPQFLAHPYHNVRVYARKRYQELGCVLKLVDEAD